VELRIGLVGAGRLAEVGYPPALAAASGVRLVAVAEPDPARMARVAADAEASGHPDAASLLADAAVDALILATPASAHLAGARLAAAAGVPALVEKPPAATAAEAAELTALDPAPRIAFNRRFARGAAALRAATPRGGEVGLVFEISYRRAGWGAHTVADDALADLGSHLVDLARWTTGAEVTEVLRASVEPERAEFDLQLGAARARIRCATDQPYRERYAVRHRDGRLIGQRTEGGPLAALRDRVLPRPHALVASLTAQVEAFARVVRGEPEKVLGTAADGVAVMSVIEAVRVRAAAGAPVRVKG
jgi:predicted dehydrogenase